MAEKATSKNKTPTAPKALFDILEKMELKVQSDKDFVTRAYELARKAHRGQKRYSGEPYLNHVVCTALYLAKIGMGPTIVSAGLLHDTLEDSDITHEQIAQATSEEVANLVEGVTKLGHVRYHGMQRHTESLRKLFAATSQDVRVMLIKLADRLHNAHTLEFVPREDKRSRIAHETLEIYAPIADRLGMGVMKREIEDAVFPFAYPEEYKRTKQIFKEMGGEELKRLEHIHNNLRKKLGEYGVKKFRTMSRIKGLYSLYRKLERKNWDSAQINDIWALRIIVPTVSDCYTVLGIVHSEWRPLYGRLKDYIAAPKPNGYRSIHTTVHTGENDNIEIQIRTEEMHKEAQWGVASHFTYKEATTRGNHSRGGAMSWIRQFIPARIWMESQGHTENGENTYSNAETPEWLKNIGDPKLSSNSDPKAFLQDIKSDFFNFRVFVFTPRGDVIDLPINASPIDFAYAIHSEIGNHMSGAKVNGKLASLDTPLKNGDVVEITTSPKSHPTQKWLSLAKTSLAKRHIKAYLTPQGSHQTDS